MATLNTGSGASPNPIVTGQIVQAEHVARIINALNGDASNTIIINADLIQGNLLNSTDGSTSHAQGSGSTASGLYSHAEGKGTTASGDYSHAEGSNTVAPGLYSHAEGKNTNASGEGAHASGENTTADGDYSFTAGFNTVAAKDYQTAVGEYNKSGNTTDVFVVGVGDGVTRADGFGVNSTKTYISTSLYLPTLTNTGQTNVVTFNSSGQLFYAASESIRVTSAYTL
jgi:hypothetical protein